MYGTRDAPAVWQRKVKQMLLQRGFVCSKSVACLYLHPQTDVQIVAHVDDFPVGGCEKELMKLKEDLQVEFEFDGELHGARAADENEAKFLGIIVRWATEGLEWEEDTQICRSSIEEHVLGDSNIVEQLGLTNDDLKIPQNMIAPEAALYQRSAAKIKYLAQDRPDLVYASKELSRTMSCPIIGDEIRIERVVSYLRGNPWWIVQYNWQNPIRLLDIYTDSDWGGCLRTRKSTIGRVIFRGKHMLLHGSRAHSTTYFSIEHGQNSMPASKLGVRA